MYTLILIVFIAEVIIASQIILLICKFDRKICEMNEYVNAFNPLAETFLKYIRLQVVSITNKVAKITKFIEEQKKKAIFKILIIVGINIGFILFKIKKIKTHKMVNLAVAMLDIASDMSLL